MNTEQFFEQLHTRIAKYDLLCHPFYKAWSAGELTREDLQAYARDYYHHVEAFPIYLAELGIRLDESELRQAILANMADEKGMADASGRTLKPHSELWLDFAEGMGAKTRYAGTHPHPRNHAADFILPRSSKRGHAGRGSGRLLRLRIASS